MEKIEDELTTLYNEVNGMKGAEGIASRVSDMYRQMGALRDIMFRLIHGR